MCTCFVLILNSAQSGGSPFDGAEDESKRMMMLLLMEEVELEVGITLGMEWD